MKLYYFHDPKGNFGDDLNPWLWPRLLPGLLDDDRTEWFVGIGTLLNHRLPREGVKHVFGSGYGYGSLPDLAGSRFEFHAVRGPGTARALGLDPALAITDAAVLLATLELPPVQRVPGRIGFIPHCDSSRCYDWSKVCAELGFTYISAEWDVDTVLAQLRSCELVLCEAMHGAIAADTLGVPWIAVSCYDYINTFKWNDWLATLGLNYEPAAVPSLYDVERDAPAAQRVKSGVKRALRSAGLWSARWTDPPPARTGAAEHDAAVQALRRAAQLPPQLSSRALVDAHASRYLELVEGLRRRASRHAAAATPH